LAADIGLLEYRPTTKTPPPPSSLPQQPPQQSSSSSTPVITKPPRPGLLPPRVSLSPGAHKYVLIRATHPHPDATVEWFVKSAAPDECGGPYHGNVAQELRAWIAAAGYTPVVTGGGRIDYRPAAGTALVYGVSHGFGKGDHAQVAALISRWSDGTIHATYDNREGLY